MRKTADAVVIGGGAIGTSVLYHLTRLGMRDVVLLEKSALASGSTGDTAAMVRQHYSNEVSIRLVKLSLELFQRFPDEFDGADVFTPTGWLFLCPPEASSVFDKNMALLIGLGVRTWELTVDEATEELPGLNTEGIARVAFEPDSGYADPHLLASALAGKAAEAGAEIRVDTPAVGLNVSDGRVTSVATEGGEVSTPIVVNAAGPWAGQVARWAGLDLPLEISREQDIVIRPPSDAPPLRRVVSNMVDRTYFRPDGDRNILVGTGHPKSNEPADPDSFSHDADPEFIREVSRRLVRRFPALENSSLITGWSGLYTITPDWNMIVDEAPGVEGLFLAVGGSGHSFKLAPAIGLCLAERIVNGRATTVDITPLQATRFEDDRALRSTYGGNRG